MNLYVNPSFQTCGSAMLRPHDMQEKTLGQDWAGHGQANATAVIESLEVSCCHTSFQANYGNRNMFPVKMKLKDLTE